MPQVCTVCRSTQRKKIDAALVANSASLRNLAGQYDLSRAALDRHKRTCLSTALQKAALRADRRDDSVLAELVHIAQQTAALYLAAKADNDRTTMLRCLTERRAQIALRAQLAGNLQIHDASAGKITIQVVYIDKAVITHP